MYRRVVNAQLLAELLPPRTTGTSSMGLAPSAPAVTSDDFLAKLVKLLPSETVTAFIIVDGALRSVQGGPSLVLYWISFLILLFLTFPYIKRQTSIPGQPTAWLQIVVTTIGFAVWVFALGGPFAATWPDDYKPYFGTVVLALYSVGAPLLVK